MTRSRRHIGLLAGFFMLAVVPIPPGAAQEQGTVPPERWGTWVLGRADTFRLSPPPARGSRKTRREIDQLLRLQKERDAETRRSIARWTEGPAPLQWTDVALELIVDHRPRPPFAARALALLHVGMYDAMVAAYDSRAAHQGQTRPPPAKLERRLRPLGIAEGSTYASPEAAVAGAAETILAHLFPQRTESFFRSLGQSAVQARLHAGLNYRSDVTRARRLGRRVGGLVLERAMTDNSDATQPAYARPDGEGYWSPTAPSYNPPTGGAVGSWQPWLMESGSALQSSIPGPHPYGSVAFMDELAEVMRVQSDLTQDETEQAFFWADGPGTYTPAGHWFEIGLQLIRDYGLDTPDAARALALLGASQADAAIAFYDAKYKYWSIRPITAIWRLCDGDSRLCSEAEAAGDRDLAPHHGVWAPLIETPPFPSYPSGHSTFSGAGAGVLTYLFPEAGTTLEELAQQAADSRLYGGIHFRSDNEDGLVLGRAIAELAMQRDLSLSGG